MGGYAEVDVEVLREDDILKGLPARFKTWASHVDQVVELPAGFEILARSDVCEIEAMEHLADHFMAYSGILRLFIPSTDRISWIIS